LKNSVHAILFLKISSLILFRHFSSIAPIFLKDFPSPDESSALGLTRRVMENLRERLEQCLRNVGRHLEDKIFKNKMASTEFFGDSKCYIITLNVIVLFRFENRQVFLSHPVYIGLYAY
jgi:hypothetical protein